MKESHKIEKLLAKYNEPNEVVARAKIRQARLEALVIEFGEEAVMKAGGYSAATLRLYLNVTNPHSIGSKALLQAEYVLSRL